jgi:hypothetical protein
MPAMRMRHGATVERRVPFENAGLCRMARLVWCPRISWTGRIPLLSQKSALCGPRPSNPFSIQIQAALYLSRISILAS